MSELIQQYVNTDKKLKIRIEKLLTTLYLAKFSGTVTALVSNDQFDIIVNESKSYTDKSSMFLGTLPEHTLFKLKKEISDEQKTGFKEYDSLHLIFKIIENMNRSFITASIKPIAAEHFSIRPEASELLFMHAELEPFVGQKRIEIFSNFKKHYRTIFFLLLTRFASIVKSTDKEREKISELLSRSNMFDEKFKEDEVSLEEIGETEDQKLTSFLDINEKFKDVFHLFGLSFGFEESLLHKEYLRIVQKIHPDRLQNVSFVNKDRAEKFFRVVSENYELLKNTEERAEVEKLIKKYGAIRNRTEFARMKEYDEAMFKGTALLRLGNFESASQIFDQIYEQTKNPEALEKKVLSIWKKASKWTDFEKNLKYPQIKEDILKLTMIKDPDIEIFFILAEIYEFQNLIPDCMKILTVITKIQPDNFRAKGMKKRLMFYESLEKNKKK